MSDPTGWTYAELTEAFLGRGDLIDALYEQQETMGDAIDGMDTKIEHLNDTIERVKVMLDWRWGQSSEVDDLIDDIHSTIAGEP